MAHIRRNNGKWRAEVERGGLRKSRTFITREEAQAWASHTESHLMRKQALADSTLLRSLPGRFLDAMRDTAHNYEEILQSATRCGTQCGIYFLILGEEIVYIGQSVNLMHRIARHIRDGRQFDSYAILECPRDKLDETEEAYIIALMPRSNRSFGAFARRQSGGGVSVTLASASE